MDATESAFRRRLASETNRHLRAEKQQQRIIKVELKERLERSANILLDKERRKLQRNRIALERRESLQKDKNRRLSEQFISFQKKSDHKIRSLEEQLQKNQTPQVLGLLEEGNFLKRLKEMFPNDRYEHPGKGGDIVHHILERRKEAGIIVYELKKVSTFNAKHVEQTYQARLSRNADYGILVTNAKRSKDDFGFSVMKGDVIAIHPAGAPVLVSVLRNQLIRISRLKLSAHKRSQTVSAVLEYIQSPPFRNNVDKIIEDTKDLYASLKKEANEHWKIWELRWNKYRDIHHGAFQIEAKVVRFLADDTEIKSLPKEGEFEPLALPIKIG
jgi:hypothetical protein